MIDTIILAAGNGSRLKGITATGMKPLLVVNGEPLITRLHHQANQDANPPVIVTSPVNTQAICDLVGDDARYVVQPSPAGPGEALLRGLEAVRTPWVTVLMGDNYITNADYEYVQNAAVSPAQTVIGVTHTVDFDIARHFTRVSGDALLLSEEGDVTLKSPWTLWCGPLVVRTDLVREVLSEALLHSGENELKIGPYLEDFVAEGRFHLAQIEAMDIGTPDAVRDNT